MTPRNEFSNAVKEAVLTLFTSSSAPLNKRFDLDKGTIRKTTRAMLYEGYAQTVSAPDAEALSGLLGNLSHRQAISIGKMRDRDQAAITTARMADETRMARTLDNFTFPDAPGWLLWDYDDKTMPAEVRTRIEDLGGPLEALFHIWPEARHGEYAVFPSSSDGVTAPGVASLRSDGRHGYFLVADISRANEALKALEARAWAEGLAWCALSKSGAVLERSIIDAAVGSPERLIFEAAPDLVAPVMRQPRPPIVHRGKVLDIPTSPDVAEIRAAAREAIKPAAKQAEAAFIEDQAQKVADKTGADIAAARAVVRRRMKGGILFDDDVIFGPGGGAIRVHDLLDLKPHGKGMPDPVEGPEYGLTTATFLWGEGYAEPRLISHAHGAHTVYRFARYMTPADIEAAESGAERVELPAPADLPDGKTRTLEAALRGADARSAVAIAVTVVHHLQNRAPHRMSVDQAMMFVMENLPGKTLAKAEESALRARADWLVNKRKTAVLSRSGLPGQALATHDVRQVETLAGVVMDSLSGVIVLKAPMGSGKTQLVGRPFIEMARQSGQAAMAICHRVTLTAELSRRMNLTDYREATVETARGGVAVCLPSILRPDIVEAIPRPEAVFIDEIAQVLQFLSENMCSSSGGANHQIYDRLAQIVGDAKSVIVADANIDARTITFLEKCRPGERFRIFEQPAAQNEKHAEVFSNTDPVIDRIAAELAVGGKVWLATEGQKKAEGLAAHFEREGYRVMCITARTKLEGGPAAFLDNADKESRKFDLVVSSPAISSGLSVEHHEGEHFTLGAFIGAGSAIRPEDAMQQLGRVRYLKRFAIGLDYSNFSGGLSVKAIRRGIEGAAEIEDVQTGWTSFDTFKAGVMAEAINARADFGAGLWWLLEREGWTLERVEGAGKGRSKEAMQDYQEARTEALVGAEPMDKHKADLLRAMQRNQAEENRLEAHMIRLEMGQLNLTPDDIDRWDGGRGKHVRERFEDLTGADVELPFESGNLTARRFRVARRKLYAALFEGIDLEAPIPMDMAEIILDRVMERPETYAAVGIVGPKFQSRRTGKGGVLKPVIRPKQAGREVTDLLRRAGLAVASKRVRCCPKTALTSLLRESVLGQNDNRQYVLTVTPDSRADMIAWLDRRSVFDLDAALLASAVSDEVSLPIRAREDASENVEFSAASMREAAELVPYDDMLWRRVSKDAEKRQQERKRKDQERRWRDAGRKDGPNIVGNAVAEPTAVPKPSRRLIRIPKPQQIAARLSDPVSKYLVEPDGVRLVWTAAMGDAVADVFAGWRNMTPNDPSAWG